MTEAAQQLDHSWRPFPGPQMEFLERGEFEVLFGGAAGPGKTDCLIMAALRFAHHPAYRGVIFRRTFPQLQEIIDRCHEYVPLVVDGAEWRAGEHRWHLPAGGFLSLSHLQHEDSKYDHQGKQYNFIGFDELTQFSETQYLYLFSRCRSLDPTLPKQVRATTNPGGVGHLWVKRRFRIGVVEPRETVIEEVVDRESGEVHRMSRTFIPATLDDNPALMENDPLYLARLELLPEVEKKRLRYGLWDVFEGQAFGELNEDVHGFDFEPSPEWEVFGSFDWGSSKPWSYGLWAVDFDGRLYRFAEACGAKQDDNGEYLDEGRRETDPEIARQILELEMEHKVKPRVRVACIATFATKPLKGGVKGPAPAETMGRSGVHFVRGDQDRVPGRRQLHLRLALGDDGSPSMFVHKRCKYWWQTLPLLVEDEKNPEDILEKNQPDHAYEETRMALMSRPIRPKTAAPSDVGSFQYARRKLIAARKLAQRRGISLEAAYRR